MARAPIDPLLHHLPVSLTHRNANTTAVVIKRNHRAASCNGLRGEVCAMGRHREKDDCSTLRQVERDILELRALGISDLEVAAQLWMSLSALRVLRENAMRRHGCRTEEELIRLATERGWLRLSPPSPY